MGEPTTSTEKRHVVLASTMRSGSTLLKALLATAPDIAHLPEINFQTLLFSPRHLARLDQSVPEPVLLLKRPAWFHETRHYPVVPDDPSVKRIILLRDAYDTVRSVGRMLLGKRFDRFPGLWGQRFLARRYWVPATHSLLAHAARHSEVATTVRYEDILKHPEEETLRLFRFVGSVQDTGLRSYETPETFRWKWGSDDGSPQIRTRTVQPPRKPSTEDVRRAASIAAIPAVRDLRAQAGYASQSC